MNERLLPTRRTVLQSTGLAALGLAAPFPRPALAQNAPLRVGFMLPYTGTYAKLGKFIDEGFRLYVAGQQQMDGFKEGFTKAGGKVVEELTIPFPEVEFQALLTRIAQIKPDAVHAFFAGAGAVKFV